ncbi:hypothetical protein CRENBAI_008357, partial [Crenichthys baileyi]
MGEKLFRCYLRLLTSRSLLWQRLEVANQILDWLEVWGGFFPHSPLTPEMVEGERQRAVAEIGPLFHLIPGGPDSVGRLPPFLAPVLSSTPLSTEGRRDASAPCLTSGRQSSLLPTPAPVPLPKEELRVELPPHPAPVLEELEIELPPLPLPVPEALKNELPPLPLPVSEGFKDELPPIVPVPYSTTDFHGHVKGPSSSCTARHGPSGSCTPRQGSSGFYTAHQGSTVVPALKSSTVVQTLLSSTAGFLVADFLIGVSEGPLRSV